MNKQLVIQLSEKAQEIAKNFSNPNRECNLQHEEFRVAGIRPLSETTAAITFYKSTNKLALAFAYYISAKGGYWAYFFPKESHIHGMMKLSECLDKIEQHNFKNNGC